MQMDNTKSLLALQKQNEDIAMKQLEEAKTKLENIKKQRDESKKLNNHLKTEIETLNLKELALKEMISAKKENESLIKTECEQIVKQLDDISWKRKIVTAKREMEENNRKPYEEIMDTPIVPYNFIEIDEFRKESEEMESLKNKLISLQNDIDEKRKLNSEYEKNCLNIQTLNKTHLETLTALKKNIERVETLINQQEEELKNLRMNL